MLFAANWGPKGSKKRVIAADTVVKYFEDVKTKYAKCVNGSVQDCLELIFTKVLPIPEDMITIERLAEAAFDGDNHSDEQFERLLKRFRKLRDHTLDFYEFSEQDRVHFFEDYRTDRPPRARHGFWSWNEEQWKIKDHSIMKEEEESKVDPLRLEVLEKKELLRSLEKRIIPKTNLD